MAIMPVFLTTISDQISSRRWRGRVLFGILVQVLLFQSSISFHSMIPEVHKHVERKTVVRRDVASRVYYKNRVMLLGQVLRPLGDENDVLHGDGDENHGMEIQKYAAMSLLDLLNELNDRGIAFSPSNTRQDLEKLLVKHDQGNSPFSDVDSTTLAESPEDPATNPSNDSKHKSTVTDAKTTDSPNQKFRIENVYEGVRLGSSKPRATQTESQNDTFDRQRRRNTTLSSQENKDDHDSYYHTRGNDDSVILEGRDLRRSRRQQRQRQQAGRGQPRPVTRRDRRERRAVTTYGRVDGTILSPLHDVIPEKWVDVGVKASNVAKRKSEQLWKEFVDMTYEGDGNDEYCYSGRQKRREARQHRQEQSRNAVEDDVITKIKLNLKTRLRRNENTNAPSVKTCRSTSKRDVSHQAAEESNSAATAISEEIRSSASRPISEMLNELDELNITYLPTSSRKDLEALLAKWHHNHKTELSSTGEDPTKPKNYMNDNSTTIQPSVVETIPKYRQELLDARITVEDIADDVLIEVEYISPEEWEGRQEKLRDQKRKEVLEVRKVKQQHQKESRKKVATSSGAACTPLKQTATANRPRQPMTRDFGVTNSSRMRNIPMDFTTVKRKPSLSTGKSSRAIPAGANALRNDRTSQKPRKVYSPYGKRAGFVEEEDVEIKDSIERFGDVLAGSVDSLLWGPDDDGDEESDATSVEDCPSNSASKSNSRKFRTPTRPQRQPVTGNWRDRLEERVDTVLGIRQDGSTYKRWMDKELKEEAETTGTDALSYARGTARKKRRGSGKLRRKGLYQNLYNDDWDMPFWEQDGSFVSMLLGGIGGGHGGRNRPSSRRYNDGSLMGGLYQALHTSSLSLLLRSLLVFSATIFGKAIRWASVCDTIPRPLVAFVLLATGVSFRGRLSRRSMNMVFALFSLRVIGEWLDGYLSDDDSGDEREGGIDDEFHEKRLHQGQSSTHTKS